MRSTLFRSRVRPICGVLAMASAAVACSSGNVDELSADQLNPPASWTSEEQVILDVYSTFRTELTDATATKDGDLDPVFDLASPRLAEALEEVIVGDRSVGNVVRGTYDFTPLSVTMVADDEAEILMCAWDQTYVYNEGEQLSEVPEAPETAKVDMKLMEGVWLVNGIFDGAGQTCELQ
ncbi:MAG: hypothetical protein R2733_00370 [Acidimicrobiales bacterium]